MADVTWGIPGPNLSSVKLRYSQLPRTSTFGSKWGTKDLVKKDQQWWEVDLSGIPDGSYEYDFEVVTQDNRKMVVPDPYAKEITRFGEYRGVFHLRNGDRHYEDFDWQDDADIVLPQNNEIVIYELPVRWVETSDDGRDRQIGLGSFEGALTRYLDHFIEAGVNCIELLPVQDSPDTLNWGYGTRFFFAPDFDLGTPFDLKLFIKKCHQKRIRVILDVVMNHAKKSPLWDLAKDMFFVDEQKDRNAWGGSLFWYDSAKNEGFHARQHHYGMAEYWIRNYHIDGFRIDEFKGIQNYDFLREFRRKAWECKTSAFSKERPFIVIAEDSWRRADVTQDFGIDWKVVDSTWDFDFRDEVRRLVTNNIWTEMGKPSRAQRAMAMIKGDGVIDGADWRKMWDPVRKQDVNARFEDLSQRVTYCSSHDVQQFNEQRLFPFLYESMEQKYGGKFLPCTSAEALPTVLEQHVSTFAITLTAAGIPMFLGGDCFADLHDIPHEDWRQKMQDPIEFTRKYLPGHAEVFRRIGSLIRLRTNHPALHRNEVDFFGIRGTFNGFHPSFDENPPSNPAGPLSEKDQPVRVFAYCRTSDQPLGAPEQVVVVANCGPHDFTGEKGFLVYDWRWGALTEHGQADHQNPPQKIGDSMAKVDLRPFQVRVFST